jgi:hypothetical protein
MFSKRMSFDIRSDTTGTIIAYKGRKEVTTLVYKE